MSYTPVPIGTPRWGELLNAAMTDLDARAVTAAEVQAASDTATTAASDAQTAAAAAQAVGDTNDGIMAGVDANAASAFRVQQDARLADQFVGQGPAATGVAATDRANLQAVLDASPAGRQRLPRGVYLIDATLTVPAGADVDFGGSTIRRAAGAGAFHLITATGGGIHLAHLTVDGNASVDSLVPANVSDRFGGIVLSSVTNSLLTDIRVTGTVNAEDTAGIYLTSCTNVVCRDVEGWNNDQTAILLNLSSQCTIDGALTHNNTGSGISSYQSPECTYTNITTRDNGYSNLSVNGLRCRVSNVLTYGSAYSGLNIGHDGQPTDGTQVSNVQAYGNTLDGITITGSARVGVSNFEVYGNSRNNILVTTGSTAARLTNGASRDSAGGQGIYLQAGAGHVVSSVAVHGNAVSGVSVGSGVSGVTLQGVKAYNNGKVTSGNSAGILLNTATLCKVIGCDAYDDQATKTQESGIWIAAGSNHVVTNSYVPVNKTYGIRQTSTPTGLVTANNITA